MICAKGGGLASSNEIFTVGCSIVGIAFEFLISTNDVPSRMFSWKMSVA